MPPLPKRSSERRRRNKVPGETTVQMAGLVSVPRLPKETHPIARRWFNSLKESGQSQFYEPSDWAQAVYVTQLMTVNLHQGARMSSMMASVIFSAMDSLLTNEAARRKARLEVERGDAQPVDDKPTALDEYRKVLGG